VERIVLATRNPGKARELSRLLRDLADRFESIEAFPEIVLPPEGCESYRANARVKAHAVSAALGLPAIGDDSGLEVDALGGAPGLRSARFAGEHADDAANNELLLERLQGVSSERRTARFRCALALVDGTAADQVVEATCEGRILEYPRGIGGFGYDPLFVPDGETRTFAELPAEVKDRIGHRGRAAAALRLGRVQGTSE
jgi:XTP/dITP diphosphohydrolase